MINQHLENLLEILPADYYIGHGDSNAKILFIGKEAAANPDDKIYHGTVQSWLDKNDYSKPYIPTDKAIKTKTHTWYRYQKLYDHVYYNLKKEVSTKKDDYELTFVENIFSTELSSLPAKTTTDAKKNPRFDEELGNRKKLFFSSDFIKSFPIILIFANDTKYIETYKGEVCELFNVQFDRQIDCSKTDKIWVHYSVDKNNPKLVIHTRQLTNSIARNLISSIGDEVVNFINKNNIIWEKADENTSR
jgi:hypothetical protein